MDFCQCGQFFYTREAKGDKELRKLYFVEGAVDDSRKMFVHKDYEPVALLVSDAGEAIRGWFETTNARLWDSEKDGDISDIREWYCPLEKIQAMRPGVSAENAEILTNGAISLEKHGKFFFTIEDPPEDENDENKFVLSIYFVPLSEEEKIGAAALLAYGEVDERIPEDIPAIIWYIRFFEAIEAEDDNTFKMAFIARSMLGVKLQFDEETGKIKLVDDVNA